MFKTSRDRLTEVQLYELVAKEIENNQQSKGLWAKAFADTKGDFEKAEALYIKLRVQMIKDELVVETRLIKDEWANKGRQSEEAEQAKAPEKLGVGFWLFVLVPIITYVIFTWVNNDF
jgi:hypothetical protein